MKTPEQYVESLRKLNLEVYLLGERVKNPADHPIIRPSLHSVSMTFRLAQEKEHQGLMTTRSHLTGKTINRFTAIHQSNQDLVNKVKMQRLLGQKTASCFQRCVGMDAMNALYSTTFETDEK
jgi:4-hydroxybutyryl-CoA dehydratase/vinylacetyl-CoA-Delta-isomerase